MDTCAREQALRREAIRRHLAGERRGTICRDLERSPRWFNKWWAVYQRDPRTDFADQSRRPRTSPRQLSAEVERTIVTVRKALATARTSPTRYGLIGSGAIQGQLIELKVQPVPGQRTIQRVLQQHGLTHPLGAGQATAYYPWPVAWDVNVIQATDIITRHVYGGEAIENFHTLDHYSQAVWLTQHPDQSSATAREHLLKTWAKLGLPLVHQFDNEGAFCGGHTHPRILGQVVRLCLFCGVEPWFIPVYDAKRNYQVETFHSLWVKGFWSRQRFRDLAHVQREAPTFWHWYHYHYRPPSLEGRTPAQMRHGVAVRRLTPDLQHLIPAGRLPVTSGRVHLLRRVNDAGQVQLLNETWPIGDKWIGHYIRTTINTREQKITFWHQPEADARWRLIQTRKFPIEETVHALLPEFRYTRARCLGHWPD